MKTVSIDDLASAIGKTVFEFQKLLPMLTQLGFPSPEESSEEFDIVKILDWVGEQHTMGLNIVLMVTEKFTSKH